MFTDGGTDRKPDPYIAPGLRQALPKKDVFSKLYWNYIQTIDHLTCWQLGTDQGLVVQGIISLIGVLLYNQIH